MKAVADTLGVSRSNLIERLKGKSKPRGPYHKVEDAELLPAIRRLVDQRPTYGAEAVHLITPLLAILFVNLRCAARDMVMNIRITQVHTDSARQFSRLEAHYIFVNQRIASVTRKQRVKINRL